MSLQYIIVGLIFLLAIGYVIKNILKQTKVKTACGSNNCSCAK